MHRLSDWSLLIVRILVSALLTLKRAMIRSMLRMLLSELEQQYYRTINQGSRGDGSACHSMTHQEGLIAGLEAHLERVLGARHRLEVREEMIRYLSGRPLTYGHSRDYVTGGDQPPERPLA